jgi:hypothetical protein
MSARARSFLATLSTALVAIVASERPHVADANVAPASDTSLDYVAATAPFTSGMSDIGTAGGLSQVSGGNFVGSASNPPKAWIFLSGYPGPATSMSVTYNSSSSLYMTLAGPGPYATGVYPVQIDDTDGRSVLDMGNLHITPEINPATEFGANLIFDYDCSLATCSGSCTTGSAIAAVPDQTSNGNTLNLVSATAPTIQQNDTRFSQPNVTTCVMSSANSTYLEQASLSLAGASTLYVFGAVYVTNNPAAVQGIWDWSFGPMTAGVNYSPSQLFIGFGQPGNITGINAYNMGAILVNGATASGAQTMYVNNAVSGSGSYGGNAPASGHPFYIGERISGAGFGSFVWPRIFGVNVVPTATNRLHMAQFLNNEYGVTPDPGYLFNTGMAASTASTPLRVQNSAGLTNYYTGTTASLVSGANSYSCTNGGLVGASGTNSMDLVCPSTPVGTYDLDIINPDGNTHSYSGVVTVTAGNTPWTTFGENVTEQFDAAHVTCSASPCVSGSSGVTSHFDMSALGLLPTQSTFANEPTWHSGVGDATCNNQPYATGNGSSSSLTTSGAPGVTPDPAVSSSTAITVFAVLNQGVTGVTTGNFFSPINSPIVFSSEINSMFPALKGSAVTATYGSTISGAQNIELDTPSGASPTLYVNVANSGSAVTAATTQSANSWSGSQRVFMYSANGSNPINVPMCEVFMVNTTPTSGQRISTEARAVSVYGAQ